MIKARNKRISLLVAIVFVLTLVLPMGSAFAADADIGGSYKSVTTGDARDCGKVTVKNEEGAGHDSVVIKLSLPDGVDFSDTPEKADGWYTVTGATYVDVDTSSDYYEVELTGSTNFSFDATFNFSGAAALDIDDDFAGNLDVNVEVIGMDSANDDVLWTESDTVTIAKVAGGDVTVKVGDAKKVSMGGGKAVADITLEETVGGVFGKDDSATESEIITLELENDGAEFDSISISGARLGLGYATDLDLDEDDPNLDEPDELTYTNVGAGVSNVDIDGATMVFVKVTGETAGLAGKIKFEDIKVNVAPDVEGDIEISVTSDGDADLSEDVVVATVGDVTAELADIDDNDTVAYAGQSKKLDVEFTIATTDGNDFDGDILTFKLNQGTIIDLKHEGAVDSVKYYSDDEAFYVTTKAKGNGDEITIKDIEVALDNDAEPGDLTLAVGGDFELDDIVIGKVAKPYTVSAETPAILSEALNQAAGDLIITETAAGAFEKTEPIIVELPSGVELAKKPKIEVTEGTADAKITAYDDESFTIEITKESGSKPSVIRVYNIAYDTGKLALTGDVTLKFSGDVVDGDDDSQMCTVANATVGDPNKVTASFKIGDEGVIAMNGRTLVQVNLLCDVLGLQKSWDAASKTAYFVKAGNVVAFPIGKNQIIINGNPIAVDQGGVAYNNFTYATLRGLQMAFGGELTWDQATQTATFDFSK